MNCDDKCEWNEHMLVIGLFNILDTEDKHAFMHEVKCHISLFLAFIGLNEDPLGGVGVGGRMVKPVGKKERCVSLKVRSSHWNMNSSFCHVLTYVFHE